MQINQDKKFQPITIVIETEKELQELYIACNYQIKECRNNLLCSKINTYLYDNNIMSLPKAKKLSENV